MDDLRAFVEQHQSRVYSQYPAIPAHLQEPWQRADWVFYHSHSPWLKLKISAPFKEMLAEAQNLRDRFVRHRTQDGQGWMSLCVHGIASDMTDAYQAYQLDEKDVTYDWTDIADQCPVTVRYFRDEFPYIRYQRLRFMLIEPGGYILPHSDNNNSNLGAAVNFSLNNPQGCKMVTEQGVLPFEDTGSVFLFNNHYRHCVVNDSDQDRYHMIVHGHWDPLRWNQLVCDSYPTTL